MCQADFIKEMRNQGLTLGRLRGASQGFPGYVRRSDSGRLDLDELITWGSK